jgi:hypothetical protein
MNNKTFPDEAESNDGDRHDLLDAAGLPLETTLPVNLKLFFPPKKKKQRRKSICDECFLQ